MKLTASTTTPTTTPCPSGAGGRGLSPFKREVGFDSRHPPPPSLALMGRSVRVTASKNDPDRTNLPVRSSFPAGPRSQLGLHRLPRLPESLPGRIGLSGRLSVRARRPALAFGPKQVGFRYPVGSKPTLPDPSPFTVRGSTAPRERSNRQSLAQSCHLTTTPRERRCPSTL